MDLISSLILWLFLGFGCILIEFIITGIGGVFLGIGSLINAVMIYNYPSLLNYQYISFGIFSLLSFLILWKPLKNFINLPSKEAVNFDIIGSIVEVTAKNIIPGEMGEVIWSGAIMNAKLGINELDIAYIGEKLYVKKVQGNILICVKNLN